MKTDGSAEPFCFFGSPHRRIELAVSTHHVSKSEQPWSTTVVSRWLGLMVVAALVIVALDVATKWLIVREIGPGAQRSGIAIDGDFIEFRYSVNAGIAFGLLDGNSTLTGLLVGLVIVPMAILLIYLATRGAGWALGSGLVLGGAAGNLIDRIGDGRVTDFVVVGRWPSFNLADAAITIGALILFGLSLLERQDDPGSEGTGSS